MTQFALRLLKSTRAASAAEFALTLPLLLVFLFGIIDAGRFAWEYNKAEKATQIGARFAAVTDPVAPGLVNFNFATGGLNAGDTIPASSLGTITCNSTTCTCSGTCPTGTGTPTGAWTQLVARMRQIDPSIQEANVQVLYSGSGIGFAGDPTGMDIVPIVTVQLTNMTFRPLLLLALQTVNMPDFHASLTAEDSIGSQSN
ncbi:MAG TPA: TadE/TadG family type IV pilus assembly protein [Sphingomicrobium sp.]|nr:TadE/TadG family type IV pilus assembly protein [Sphingomicrobium sp.]